MVVGTDGAAPLPWLAGPLARTLAGAQGHALLLHAAPGAGALPFALTLAQAWLCETGAASRGAGTNGALQGQGAVPCGRCASCHMVRTHLHPDLFVLMPEELRRAHDWLLAGDRPEGDEGKRKPSRQIRIGEVRDMVDWVGKTSALGRGKVVVLHPAQALNSQSANALLKTLEEPPIGTRLLLTAGDPECLLPTLRSRCQQILLPLPDASTAQAWLEAQHVDQPQVLLAASGGLPLDALALHRAGIKASSWSALPAAMAAAQAAALTGWPVARLLDALQKLCHDALARSVGGSERYFPPGSVSAGADPAALAAWSLELQRVARHADHPWHEPLLLDALVKSSARALRPARPGSAPQARRLDTLPT